MHNKVSCWKKAVFSRCSKTFKKQESHEVQVHGNDCFHVQKNVLFTGLSEIAKSKRCRRIATKLFVFFLCTSGFFYQAWTFLEMYLVYPTTLETSYEYPDTFTLPAISICNRNRFWRQRYCRFFPGECTWEHTTWESFCDSHRRMCPETKPPNFHFGVPKFRALFEPDRQAFILNLAGPIIDKSSIPLIIFSGNGTWSSSFMIGRFSKNGFLYKCFTLFSTLLSPDTELQTMTLSDGYSLAVDLHPEEYFNSIDLVEASVVLHDPRQLVNPMTEGITLAPGKVHMLFPTMERTEKLPQPYASNCKDYVTEWKKTEGYGPLSKDDCINECKIKTNIIHYGCVGQSMTFAFDDLYPICDEPTQEPSSEDHRNCTNICQDACEETIYPVTVDTVSDFPPSCNATDEHCKNRYLYIHVTFNRMQMKKFKQMPRIEGIELFSYIGGYLGMWLGISLASVFDLAEMIYDVIHYAFLKLKRKIKMKPPTE